MSMLILTIGCVVSLIGFLVARYISNKTTKRTPLMCPRSAPCEDVVGSAYGKTLGISTARLGQVYYLFVALLFLSIMDTISFPLQLPLLLVSALVGFIFSLYLVSIQLFVLHRWCLWCMFSALCAIIIFISAVLLFS